MREARYNQNLVVPFWIKVDLVFRFFKEFVGPSRRLLLFLTRGGKPLPPLNLTSGGVVLEDPDKALLLDLCSLMERESLGEKCMSWFLFLGETQHGPPPLSLGLFPPLRFCCSFSGGGEHSG